MASTLRKEVVKDPSPTGPDRIVVRLQKLADGRFTITMNGDRDVDPFNASFPEAEARFRDAVRQTRRGVNLSARRRGGGRGPSVGGLNLFP